MKKVAGVLIVTCALAASGCGLFHRDTGTPTSSTSPSRSQSVSPGPTTSPTVDIPLSTVVSSTRDAGGAAIKVVTSLTGADAFSGTLAGALDLDTGSGRGDFTSANGRTSERVITGGKTYTSAGTAWVATAQTGRGLLGGDLPSLWRLLSTMSSNPVAGTLRGSIPLAEALAIAGVDSTTAAQIKSAGQRADVSVEYNSEGVVTQLGITWSDGKHSLTVNMTVGDVGQVIDVSAPTEVVTGGPESQ
ncbi:MAG: hypothetical protein EB027_01350 [Actinobacteria bacterium]|nr:hypothetical protein [Actinomycetota bacterium]